MISRLSDVGGAEGSTALLLAGLQGNGVEFGAVTFLHDLDLRGRSNLEARGARFFDASPGKVEQLRCTLEAIKAVRPDLIHATLFDSEMIACVAGLISGTPVLRSIVNAQYGSEAKRAARSRIRLELVRRIDSAFARFATFRFHAISAAVAGEAISTLGIDSSRVTVVPRGRDERILGFNSPERRARVRQALGIADSALVLINVARQDTQKGQLYLLEALDDLRHSHPRVLLVIAGRAGSATEVLRTAIRKLELGDRVMFLGMREDVPDLLCAADLFVFSSLWEGLGGALLEAMALGVPIVSFAVPAVAEALGDAAVLVPTRDGAKLRDAISEVLDSPLIREDLSRRGEERFHDLFTIEKHLERMQALYVSVVDDAATKYRDPFAWLRRRRTLRA